MKKTMIWTMLLMFLLLLFALPVMATEAVQEPRAAIDLTPIFQAVIALLAALVTGRLVPWIKSKTTENQQYTMMSIVRTMVFAAEQLYGSGNGAAKLGYVEGQLKEAGYDVNAVLVKNTIESVVKELAHWNEKPPDASANQA